jgi:hypothetical protein
LLRLAPVSLIRQHRGCLLLYSTVSSIIYLPRRKATLIHLLFGAAVDRALFIGAKFNPTCLIFTGRSHFLSLAPLAANYEGVLLKRKSRESGRKWLGSSPKGLWNEGIEKDLLLSLGTTEMKGPFPTPGNIVLS